VPPETELQLNSPTPLTLRLLGVIFLATFLPWVAAKIACNEREGPIRVPPTLATEILSKQPKDAAIELAQRAATGQFAAAAELAKGELAQQLAAEQARCQAEPKPCEARRAAENHTFSRGVLVRRGPGDAEVRVESVGGPQPERYMLHLEADGGRWFATARSPFVGEITEPTVPAPAASAADGAGDALPPSALPPSAAPRP
jgi:hypothetical protein